MKTAMLTVKMEPKIKEKAKQTAKDLGFSLSSLVNGFIHNLIRTGKVSFETGVYEPSDYLLEALEEAEKNRKDGYVSPSFDNIEDSFKWLDDPNRKYVRDLQ